MRKVLCSLSLFLFLSITIKAQVNTTVAKDGSGVNLLNNISITAPTNFQISLDNVSWNTNPIILTQTSSTVNNTLIYVRLNAASAGNYSGKIVHQTNGTSTTYTDDAATRVTGLDATTPTFNKLFTSNGTTVPSITAYSTSFEQAFGATANGAFVNPILLPNQTSGPTTQYGLALNAGNGINIAAGEILSIRLYFSCCSSSTGRYGRYGMLKTVQVKGLIPTSLPVKIKSYELKLTNEKQVLNLWTTSSEINTSHFNIQKSFDGRSFENIGKVNAVGTYLYSFKDDNASNNLSTKNYYRLEVVDYDGSKNYTEIKVISLLKGKSNFSFYPNPAKAFIVVESKNVDLINIIDIYGRTVKQMNNVSEQQIINTTQLAKGFYFLQVTTSKKEIFTDKFLVE